MLSELLVLAAGAAFLGLPAFIFLRKKRELQNKGILTKGHISKVEAISENEDSDLNYYYYVSYSDEKGKHLESRLLRHDKECAFKQGDEIMIRYKPGDTRFVAEEKKQR